jgi:hypothetical protein
MLHATYTQINWGDSRLLMVKSQIVNLTIGHNLCLKCPNGSCEPILDIFVSRTFCWYKEFLNVMGSDPCNCWIFESPSRLRLPKVGAQLGVWWFIPSQFPTTLGAWNVTPGLHFWLAPSQALALVASPRLGLQHLLQVMGNHHHHQPLLLMLVHVLFDPAISTFHPQHQVATLSLMFWNDSPIGMIFLLVFKCC